MNTDRNKTSLTKRVTQGAAMYLAERGCKPLETEVPICQGWIADLAGVIDPTETELIKLKLVSRKPKWKAPQEVRQSWEQQKDAVWRLLTVLVEVKTSRSDFAGDKKWTLPIPVDAAYIAVPNDLKIAPDEWPAGWGRLLFSEAGGYVKLAQPPVLQNITVEQQRDVILSVAIRRDHHTRYARMRDLQKQIRDEENERKSMDRFGKILFAMRDIVRGEHDNIERVFQYHGIKHIPFWLMDELRGMWAIAKVTAP